MPTFSHSGTTGDVFLSLSVIRALGGGHLYLKLYNMDAMIREKLGWPGAGDHSGRMTHDDFESMREFIEHQPYITGYTIWNGEPVDYDLDNAGKWFTNVGQFPHNYPNTYARACGLDLDQYRLDLQVRSWMECRDPVKIEHKPIVVFRGPRHNQGNGDRSEQWMEWVNWGLEDQAVFVGLPSDYEWFTKNHNCPNLEYYPTKNMWELARVIAGSEMLITSMSSPCAVGLALGKTMWIECRKTISMERIESNFPWRANVFYF